MLNILKYSWVRKTIPKEKYLQNWSNMQNIVLLSSIKQVPLVDIHGTGNLQSYVVKLHTAFQCLLKHVRIFILSSFLVSAVLWRHSLQYLKSKVCLT